DEFSAWRFKIAIGHVNRNALFALGAQTVSQQRKIHGARGAIDAAFLHSGKLILEHGLGVMKQPANQRRFAIIHAAGRRESQQLLLQVMMHEGLEAPSFRVRSQAHQKYPSRFLISIEPPSS